MNRSFNLVDEPWIPVAGEVEKRSLMSIFTNNPKMLRGNPVDKIVIFRLLLSIVHASTTIENDDDWKNLSEEQIAENARKYLSNYHDLFDIYNEGKPFLQFPQLKNMNPIFKPLHNKITVGYGDNKSLLTDRDHDETITDAEKAVLLLRIICFNFASKSFNKNVIFSVGHTKNATAKPGTLLGTGYLHSYLKGNNLWQSLKFNLLTEEEIKELKCQSTVIGKPAWEEMPTGEDDVRANEFKKSYMGILLPLDKFVLFTEDNKIIKTDGIPYKNEAIPENCIDPALTVINIKNKLAFFKANPSKSVWRELESIFSFINIDNSQFIQPYFFSYGIIKKLRSINKNEVTFWVGGISVTNKKGELVVDNNDNYVESEFKLSLLNFTVGLNRYKDNMCKLNHICKNLSDSVVKFFNNTNRKTSSNKIKNKIEEMFWENMESHKNKIIEISFIINTDIEIINIERILWKKISEEVFDEICPNIADNRFKEWIKAKNNLIKMNYKI